MQAPARLLIFLAVVLACPAPPAVAASVVRRGGAVRAQDPELAELLAEERAELARLIAHGALAEARASLDEILDEDPGDWRVRALRLSVLAAQDDYAALRGDLAALGEAFAAPVPAPGHASGHASGHEPGDAPGDAPENAIGQLPAALASERAAAARWVCQAWIELGEPEGARAAIARGGLEPSADARDAWLAAEVERLSGERGAARAHLEQGASLAAEQAAALDLQAGLDWLAAKARCQRALGRLESASGILAGADAGARRLGAADPDVLAELGGAYFEAYGEVDDPRAARYRPGQLYREVLAIAPGHEVALVGLWRLARTNWMRQSRSASEWLDELARARPGSLAGALARASQALDDADWRSARRELAWLEERAPLRREVRAERAALCFLEQESERGRALLAELAASDPDDPAPELCVGTHLIAAYRFDEARTFLEAAAARAGADAETFTRLGEALANVGDEAGARAALERADAEAEGRVDVWRANMLRVLGKLEADYACETHGQLSFCWQADEAPLERLIQVPFYAQAREELCARYGHTPGPTTIEVFRSWDDFSVRSTGYQGFPGLGVCFGPVVTSISPLWERRGSNSWARTAFHEFTHVVHLGLSHNRCPRWLTEGLATWEEQHRNPSWTRNMRRELVDARAGGTLPGLRELNGLFRGSQVIFGYYLSGLVVGMWVEERGFPVVVRMLEAFDGGADLDQACGEVLGLSPEEVDQRFASYVDALVEPLAIEPRWPQDRALRLALALTREPPAEPGARARWAEDWTSYAIAAWQNGARADADEGLRRAAQAGVPSPARALFLDAEMAMVDGRSSDAEHSYRAGFDAGGEDYLARLALGGLLHVRGELAEAEAQYLAAERDFPGFDEPGAAAELRLAVVYEELGDEDSAMEARSRWCRYDSGDLFTRLVLADWCERKGRREEAARWYQEAQEIDPFRRELQRRRGLNLAALAREPEAETAYRAFLCVPRELDGRDAAGVPLGGPDELAAELAARGIASLQELGPADAGVLAHALQLGLQTGITLGPPGGTGERTDPAAARARMLELGAVLERLGAATRAGLERARVADVRAALAEILAHSGRAEEALAECRRALEEDPGCARAQVLAENLAGGDRR